MADKDIILKHDGKLIYWNNKPIRSGEIPSDFPTDGLVAYWRFDETSGTTAVDSFGNHDGTANSSNVLTGTDGINNGCADLTGGDYSIDFGDHDDFIIGSNGFTWSTWSKRTYSNNAALITKGYHTLTQALPWYLSRVISSKAEFYLRNTSSDNFVTTSTTNVDDGKWHHIAAVVDTTNGVSILYVDGVEEHRVTNNSIKTGDFGNNTDPLVMGAHGNNYMNGLIDETAIWQRALSASEIEELYNNGNGLFY